MRIAKLACSKRALFFFVVLDVACPILLLLLLLPLPLLSMIHDQGLSNFDAENQKRLLKWRL